MTTTTATTPTERSILVWDAPVRVFHWLMVASFATAWLTAESERWRLVHVSAGYTMAGLVVFRLLWGVVGPKHARFSNFVRGPAAVIAYVKSLLARRPQHFVGHNPAGAVAIVAILALTALAVASGWMNYNEIGGDWTEELHEIAANTMMAVVIGHLIGVVTGSLAHHENLVRAMVTGRKLGDPGEAIGNAWRSVAVLMLAAVIGFGWLQWQSAPLPSTTTAAQQPKHGQDRGDHDGD